MSKASEALDNVITRPRSAEEIQEEWNTVPRRSIVVVNGQEIDQASGRIIGKLEPAVDD